MKLRLDKDTLADGSPHYGVEIQRDVEELYIPCCDEEQALCLMDELARLINNYSAEMVDDDE